MTTVSLPQYIHIRIAENVVLPVHIVQDLSRINRTSAASVQQNPTAWFTAAHQAELFSMLKQFLQDTLFVKIKKKQTISSKGKAKKPSTSSTKSSSKAGAADDDVELIDDDDDSQPQQKHSKTSEDDIDDVAAIATDVFGENDAAAVSAAAAAPVTPEAPDENDVVADAEFVKNYVSTTRSVQIFRGEKIQFTYQFKYLDTRYRYLEKNPFYKQVSDGVIKQHLYSSPKSPDQVHVQQQQQQQQQLQLEEDYDEDLEGQAIVLDDDDDDEMDLIYQHIAAASGVRGAAPLQHGSPHGDVEEEEIISATEANTPPQQQRSVQMHEVIEIDDTPDVPRHLGAAAYAAGGASPTTPVLADVHTPTNTTTAKKRKRSIRQIQAEYDNLTRSYRRVRVTAYKLVLYVDERGSSSGEKTMITTYFTKRKSY